MVKTRRHKRTRKSKRTSKATSKAAKKATSKAAKKATSKAAKKAAKKAGTRNSGRGRKTLKTRRRQRRLKGGENPYETAIPYLSNDESEQIREEQIREEKIMTGCVDSKIKEKKEKYRKEDAEIECSVELENLFDECYNNNYIDNDTPDVYAIEFCNNKILQQINPHHWVQGLPAGDND